MKKLTALCYINQFYAGIGGEEMAHEGMHVYEGAKGPAVGMNALWKGEMEVVKTIAIGDNYFNIDENYDSVKPQLLEIIKDVKPDVVIAGPAFNAGRYGVACGKFCAMVTKELGIPTVTSMFSTNPAVAMYIRDTYIMAGEETAVGMKKDLPPLAKFALKLAKQEEIGPATVEGYIPTGVRKNEVDDQSAAQRVVGMLVKKMTGAPYRTEVPLREDETTPPAPAIEKPDNVRFAIVTMGGMAPKGNPDKLRMYSSVNFGLYPIDVSTFNSDYYESVHGGYDTTAVDADPQRLVPYNAALDLKKRGLLGDIAPYFISTCGIGTNVKMGQKLGFEMAQKLKEDGVGAVILTST